MAVVRCRRCGAVATAQLGADDLETSYGASFRERCRSLADRGGPDFVSSVAECPAMDTALRKVAARLSRQRATREKVLGKRPVAIKAEAIS